MISGDRSVVEESRALRVSRSVVRTNPRLIVVQSRLHSAHYMGTGRWTIVDPTSRNSFVAVGKDEFPQILRVLLSARNGADVGTLAELSGTSEQGVERLLGTGLLLEDGVAGEPHMRKAYLQAYHSLVFEYPFHDYAVPGWKARDRAQMAQYGKQALPPPSSTPRAGKRWPLPAHNFSVFANVAGARDFTDPVVLGTLLHVVFGIVGTIESDWPMLRKTSPSGGGRHPAEAIVIVGKGATIAAGIYYYDPVAHALVSSERKYPAAVSSHFAPGGVGIAIAARVERPMWRYREPRSWRAVCVDIGHVDETLRIVATAMGAEVLRRAAPIDSSPALEWIVEPELSYLELFPQSERRRGDPVEAEFEGFPSDFGQESDRMLTNPCMSFRIASSGLVADIHWPEHKSVPVTEPQFLLLTYCLPSRRGDRPTDEASLHSQFRLEIGELQRLKKDGLLIGGAFAPRLYDRIHLWAAHNWYLSFLAMLASRPSSRGGVCGISVSLPSKSAIDSELSRSTPQDLLEILYRRKTTRAFSDRPVDIQQVVSLFRSAAETDTAVPTRVLGAMLRVADRPAGEIVQWDGNENKLVPTGRITTAEAIQAATIGQGWAGIGAVTFWVLAKVDFESPSSYLEAAITLGRYGQRLCLDATRQGLGIFVTPAVCDGVTCELLGLADSFHTIIYTMTIGYERR